MTGGFVRFHLPWLALAIGLVFAAALLTLGAVGIDVLTSATVNQGGVNGPPVSSPSPSPTPLVAPALASLAPAMVLVPPDADCGACHDIGSGVATVKAIPPLGHPLDGWRNCTACHATDRLVQTAPGHRGIHASDCLVCHREQSPAAPHRAHPDLGDTDCLKCHGTIAELPANMASRPATTCWVCHRPASVQPPLSPHALPTTAGCRTCHTGGAVGTLPADHAARSEELCTVCHAASPDAIPLVPRDRPPT